MAVGGSRGRADELCYSVELTRNGRFQATAAALAVRTAEFVGCVPARARQLGEALDRVLGWLIERPGHVFQGGSAEAPGTITIRFRDRGGALEIEVSCSDDDPVGLTAIVERAGGLTALAPLVDVAEIADASGHQSCRLTCHVPAR